MRDREKPQTALELMVERAIAHAFEDLDGRGGPTNDDVAEAVRAAFAEAFPDECLRKVHAGEPIFTLRAQDALASEMVDRWSHEVEMHRRARGLAASEKPTGARTIARRMRAWALGHGSKLPD